MYPPLIKAKFEMLFRKKQVTLEHLIEADSFLQELQFENPKLINLFVFHSFREY